MMLNIISDDSSNFNNENNNIDKNHIELKMKKI